MKEGKDFERFGDSFSRDIEKGVLKREEDKEKYKKEIQKHVEEKTEFFRLKKSKEIKEIIDSFDIISKYDFEGSSDHHYDKFSDDHKFALNLVYENADRMGSPKELFFVFKKNGKLFKYDIAEDYSRRAEKIFRKDLKKFEDSMLYGAGAIVPIINYNFEKPKVVKDKVVLNISVRTNNNEIELFSEEKSLDIEELNQTARNA
jgi:hypothetical protein